jgi:hypothetical protein
MADTDGTMLLKAIAAEADRADNKNGQKMIRPYARAIKKRTEEEKHPKDNAKNRAEEDARRMSLLPAERRYQKPYSAAVKKRNEEVKCSEEDIRRKCDNEAAKSRVEEQNLLQKHTEANLASSSEAGAKAEEAGSVKRVAELKRAWGTVACTVHTICIEISARLYNAKLSSSHSVRGCPAGHSYPYEQRGRAFVYSLLDIRLCCVQSHGCTDRRQ